MKTRTWRCWPVYREVGAVGKDRHAALRELQLTQMLPLLEGNLHFFSFTKTSNYQLELLGKKHGFPEGVVQPERKFITGSQV